MRWLISILFLIVNHSLYAQKIRLATYQYADNPRIQNISPFADHLQKQLGFAIEVKSYATVHAFIEAIQHNEVDIALINTFGYLLLESSTQSYPMKPLLALKVKADAKDNYKTAFITTKKSDVITWEDLKYKAPNLNLALVAIGSTSGNLVPRLALTNLSIKDAENNFKTVQYAGTHATAIGWVLNGKADVAAIGNTEYDKLLQNDSLAARLVKLIWLSPEIPLGPVLFNKNLKKSTIKRIKTIFLQLQTENNIALEAIKAGWSEAKQATYYININKHFYNPFTKSLGSKNDLQNVLKQFQLSN